MKRRGIGFWEVAGALLGVGVAYVVVRQLPSAVRYARMLRIAKPHGPERLLFEGDPTNAQAPRRAMYSNWDPNSPAVHVATR